MQVIHNNPFRVLGLPVTATEREITKRVADITTFLEFGKTKEYDSDFSAISDFSRTPESVKAAARAIELHDKKVMYSFFWFWEQNSVDELVFDLLKDGDTNKGVVLWRKSTTDKYIGNNNFSNVWNLAILMLALSSKNGQIKSEMFLSGLQLAGKLFSNEHTFDHSYGLIDPKSLASQDSIKEHFLDEILRFSKPYVDKPNGISLTSLISTLKEYPEDIWNYSANKFLNPAIIEIESEIKKAQDGRKSKPENAFTCGETLYNKAKKQLAFLSKILSSSDYKYQSTADKVAGEILQCSVDYFNKMLKLNKDPHDKSLALTRMASALAAGPQMKQKIKEDLEFMDKYKKDQLEEKQAKAKFEKVQSSFDFLVDQLNNLPDLESLSSQGISDLTRIANNFIVACKPKLDVIQRELGASDEDYLKMSTVIASATMNMCIVYSNRTEKYSAVMSIIKAIGSLHMESQYRGNYNKNKDIIQTNIAAATIQNINRSNARSSGGCYIATMVYGSYEAPEVKILRDFRDSRLLDHNLGRTFVRYYYMLSPYFVRIFHNNKFVNKQIKSILNLIIRIIK